MRCIPFLTYFIFFPNQHHFPQNQPEWLLKTGLGIFDTRLKKQKQKNAKIGSVLNTDYPYRQCCFLFLRDPRLKRLSFLKAPFKRHIYISLVPNLIRELNVSGADFPDFRIL